MPTTWAFNGDPANNKEISLEKIEAKVRALKKSRLYFSKEKKEKFDKRKEVIAALLTREGDYGKLPATLYEDGSQQCPAVHAGRNILDIYRVVLGYFPRTSLKTFLRIFQEIKPGVFGFWCNATTQVVFRIDSSRKGMYNDSFKDKIVSSIIPSTGEESVEKFCFFNKKDITIPYEGH